MPTYAEKSEFQKQANDAITHPLAMKTYEELVERIRLLLPDEGVVLMVGLSIANYGAHIAKIARAQALGLDPEAFEFTEDEAFRRALDNVLTLLEEIAA